MGGHKFAANVMVYRRADAVLKNEEQDENGGVVDGKRTDENERKEGQRLGEGAQCIWMAWVRPVVGVGIVSYTVLPGTGVTPESQLRGGFDRGKMVTSW